MKIYKKRMNAYIKDDIMILEINYYSMEGKSTDCQQSKRKKERIRIDLEKFNWRRNYRYSLFFIPREVNLYNFYYYIVRKY